MRPRSVLPSFRRISVFVRRSSSRVRMRLRRIRMLVLVFVGFARLMVVPRRAVLHLRFHGGVADARGVLEHELAPEDAGPDDGDEPGNAQHAQGGFLAARDLRRRNSRQASSPNTTA